MFRYIPRSEVAGNSMSNFLRNVWTVFQDCLHHFTFSFSNAQGFQFLSISSAVVTSLCLLVYLVIAILMGVNRYLIVVLICMSLRLMLNIFSSVYLWRNMFKPFAQFFKLSSFLCCWVTFKKSFVNDLNLLSENFSGS